MIDTRRIAVTVNGVTHERRVETRLTLGDFLRHELHLTGTHLGCEHGVCGACTVLVDGRSTRSCLMLAVQAHEREITTVEGLARWRGAQSVAGRILGDARPAVRLLHARHADDVD